MTRILHAASGREWRGGQRQTWLLARELQRLGQDQLLITRRGSELARRARADGVAVHEVGWAAGLDPRAWWAVRREARRGPVIIHAHDGHAVTIARWASGPGIPWIATRRNASPLREPAGWRGAARVVAISEAVRRQLLADGIPDARIAVVPSGIDLAATRATPPEDPRRWAGLPAGPPVVLTISAATPEKGLSVAVSAAMRLHKGGRDFRWVVVGDGPERAALVEGARREAGGRIVFPGHHPDPIRLLRGASLFVLPSLSEGLGTSVLDAFALDVPVVASDTGGLTELVGDGAGALVPPGDPEALAAAVARMLDDGELRARCVTAGRARVERYTVRRMAEGMRAVYDSVNATR